MSLRGNLKDFQLEEIIKFIEAGKKTGALEIKRSKESAVFFFKSGGLYFIQRSDKPVSISEKILAAGILDEDVSRDVKSGKLFPPATAPLNDEQRQKIKEIIFNELIELGADVFTLEDGVFEFKNNEKRTGEDWGVYVEPDRFLERVKKHSEIIKKFSEHARNLKTRLYLNRNIPDDEDVIISGKEWRFLSSLKDGMTVEQVARSAGLSLLASVSIATNLLEKGLLISGEENKAPEEREQVKNEVVEKIKEEAEKENEKTIQTSEEELEEVLDSDSLIDELAAITGSSGQSADDATRKELEEILKTLKNL